jgi:general secretion pathway protein G
MFRSAFSMIELVFVIVILGIMAAVAVPKFASIQDDALISNEKQTIAVARQGIATLYGQRLIRGTMFGKTLSTYTGTDYNVSVSFSSNYYPTTLNVSATSGSADNNSTTTYTTTRGDRKALALVVEAESLADWNSTGSGDIVLYTGPASNVITDGNAEISVTNGDYWEYNNTSGKILLK